jgi:hypothetical protein
VKIFLVDVLMTGSSLGENSNCFVGPGDEPSPTSGSFSLGALGDRLVFGFFGGIVPANKKIKSFRTCALSDIGY